MRNALLVLCALVLSTPCWAACPGDCDGNRAVSAAEIDLGVEILLGRAALGTCGAADADASGGVTCRDLVMAVRGLVGGCPGAVVIVSGRVADVDGGAALFGVTARLGTRTASTDSNGIFQFTGVPQGSAVVQFSRDGYAPTAETFSVAPDAAPSAVFMKAVTGKFSFAGSSGGEFQAGGSVLRVAASSLRDGSGNPVTGEVALEITKFDASGADINAFPGEFEGTTAGGQETDIESFGFATYSLTSGGGPVNLAPGATAEIEFLIADADQGKFAVGQQVGLWGYDQATGQWSEEPVSGTIRASSQQAGKLAWVADVPHFSTWNCDRPVTEKHCLRGRVERDGNPVAGAQVSAAGITYNGVSETISAADGTFCVDVKRGETVRVEVRINGAPAPLAVTEVVVPATEASCATGGCTTLAAPLSVAFDSCVSGIVLDAQGEPVPDLTVYVIPGETVTTGPDGRYCSAAPANAAVTVMAAGFLSALATTPDATACDAGCAAVDLATLLPGEGFTIASASVSYARALTPQFGGGPVQSTESMGASGNFLVLGLTGTSQGDTTVTIEDIAGCTVVTTVTVYSGEPVPPTYTVLPLDPGNPGAMSSGALAVDLLRGDPASQDPPSPFLLGTFEPAEGTDLLALGFAPGRQYGFSWPGGSDIGAFSGSVPLPPAIVVSSPNLLDPGLVLTPGTPFSTTWTPSGDAAGEMVVSLTTVRQGFDPQSQALTATSVTVTCAFPDSAGTGTISADATSRLLADGQSGGIGYSRSRETDVQAPLLRTGGTTTVRLNGQASLNRTIFGGI